MSHWKLAALFVTLGLSPALGQEPEPTPPPTPPPIEEKGETKESDQTVVITATRTETSLEQVGSSISVIDKGLLENRQSVVVPDALQFEPGVDIRRGGGLGGQTSIFMRGTNSNHTKILLDGIDISDPSAANAIAPLELLFTTGLDRVEVLRGPQSSLYGSDAIGGVVNMLTARGSGPLSIAYTQEFGSYRTTLERLSARGGDGFFHYNLNATRMDSQSISAQDNNTEDDPFRATALLTRFGFTPTDEFSVDFFVHGIESENEFDGFGEFERNQTDAERLFLKAQPQLILLDGTWVSTLNLSYTYHDRRTLDPFTNFFAPPPVINAMPRFTGRTFEVDWQNDIELTDNQLLTTGFVYRNERGESFDPSGTYSPFDDGRNQYSYYLQDQVSLTDRLTVTPGFRVDHFDDFGTKTTYRVAGAYHHKETDTVLRSSVGTGFNAPAFNQLAGFGGNPDLRPEESIGFDVGVEQHLFDRRFTAGATYFHNEVENLITFAFPPGLNVNIEEGTARGGEFFFALKPAENLTTRVSYTYTDTEAGQTVAFSSLALGEGARLLRRPLHKAAWDVIYDFWDKRANVTFSLLYVGERDDFGGAIGEAYTVANLAGSLRIRDNFTLLGRIENLFDENYQDVVGFNSPGLGIFGGFKFEF